jgi:hypothetical protein
LQKYIKILKYPSRRSKNQDHPRSAYFCIEIQLLIFRRPCDKTKNVLPVSERILQFVRFRP